MDAKPPASEPRRGAVPILGAVLLLLTSLAPAVAAQPVSRPPPDPDVHRLESALLDAMHAKDRPRLEQLLADDYSLRGTPDVSRTAWLDNAVALCWGQRSDLEDLRVRVLGDVAVAAFELTVHVDPVTCRPALLRSLVTDVWVREATGWKLKVRHSGAPPPSPGDLASQYGVVPEPPPAWRLTSDFSGVATGGNTSTRSLGLGAELVHRIDDRRTDVRTHFLTSYADGVTNARAFDVNARHGVDVTHRFQGYGALSYERNRFSGFDHRATVTGGVAYEARGPRRRSLILQGGLGWTFEERLDLATLRFVTATAALDFRRPFGSAAEFREQATFNADLESADNWRTSSTTDLTVSLTRVLSLRASHTVDYRRRPIVGFGRADLRTAMTLVFSVARRRQGR